MADTGGEVPPIVYDGRRFVGVSITARPELASARRFMREPNAAAPRFTEMTDQKDGWVSGGVLYPALSRATGTLEHVMQSSGVSLSLNLGRGLLTKDGTIDVHASSAKGMIQARKSWAELKRIDILASGECQVPDLYLCDAERRDDALVLLLVFNDGLLLPLSYSSPIEGEYLGSLDHLDTMRKEIFAAIGRVAERSVAAKQQRAQQKAAIAAEDARVKASSSARPRLGEPYVYRWVDKEPTSQTYKDLSMKIGLKRAVIGAPLIALAAFVIGGENLMGAAVCVMFFVGFWQYRSNMDQNPFIHSGGRADDEPVPKDVHKEAFIEYAGGDYNFVLMVDGVAQIRQPWARVRQFEVTEYWPMFGDAGASPYKTGWHAVAMDPQEGKPWCICSTIEGMADVRERRNALDAKFGADARGKFLRAVAAQGGGGGSTPAAPADKSSPSNTVVPPRFD
jgi:hypothetical protein